MEGNAVTLNSDVQMNPDSFSELKGREKEKEWYRERNLNIECKNAIDQAIGKNYDLVYGKLNPGTADPIINEYRTERTAYVLSLTINDSLWDGRLSLDNRSWAVGAGAYFMGLDYEMSFDHHLISSTAALDKFVSQFRKETEFDPALELIGTEKEPYPFPYRYSYNSARLKNELPEYLWSWGLNKKCAQEIDEVIVDPGHHDFSSVLATFGPERAAYVLAATVDIFKNNRAISEENKSWLDDFGYLPADSSVLESDEYLLKAGPSQLNEFLDENLPTLKRCMSIPRVKERGILNGNTEPGSYQYAIYQIDSNQCDYHFEGRDYLMEHNVRVNPADYKFVYSGTERPLHTERDALDDLFYKFNANRPDDFRGYSLSVSDVVVLNHDYRQKAYYIDKTGYIALPNFVRGRRDMLDNPFLEPDYKDLEHCGPCR